MLKALAACLPKSTQENLKGWRFRRQIRAGRFEADEPEVKEIRGLLKVGDWAIDVGANVGHYTIPMSGCVGDEGRILAFEPFAETFAILTRNLNAAHARNVTLMNQAASDECGTVSMDLPTFDSGLDNYYRANISKVGKHQVMCVSLDSMTLPKISLIKIDAEGHDLQVLKGAEKLLARDKPMLIVESSMDGEIANWLRDRNYSIRAWPGSPNLVATCT